ncbi:hypothetical protein BGZ98_006099, partial [Dissophora globulifera]
DVPSITMPVGRARELKTFMKTDVLSALKLASPRHLLLASIVTKNDYFEGIPSFGIKKNIDIVRKITFDGSTSIDTGVKRYLSKTGKGGQWPMDKFKNAISALAKCHEDKLDTAPAPLNSHEIVHRFLRSLETCRINRRATNSATSSTFQPPTAGAATSSAAASAATATTTTAGGSSRRGRHGRRGQSSSNTQRPAPQQQQHPRDAPQPKKRQRSPPTQEQDPPVAQQTKRQRQQPSAPVQQRSKQPQRSKRSRRGRAPQPVKTQPPTESSHAKWKRRNESKWRQS